MTTVNGYKVGKGKKMKKIRGLLPSGLITDLVKFENFWVHNLDISMIGGQVYD